MPADRAWADGVVPGEDAAGEGDLHGVHGPETVSQRVREYDAVPV